MITDKITDNLRRGFLEFFGERNHQCVNSSSLVPHNDQTILFTNAGMNQFKHVFTGNEVRPYKRATSCQKCMRAGGKHNDLENVGYTARHHTFFEMLGNFSFGDYFKKEAIGYAWEFVTVRLGFPKEKLYVSVYKDDDEAYKIWKDEIGIEPKRIFRMGEKDNFWSMGETGPCGPCSEIFYDQGEGVGCGKKDCSPECDCDRHLEIWNLVFMEFNRDESGNMSKLPKPCIDTGMGLERVSAIKHGVLSNYDIDVFKPMIKHLEEISGKDYSGKNDDLKISMRAIADHVRACTFLMSEGIVPSNEGRGYVLRRIVRRGMRHGNLLGIKESFLYKLVDDLVETMGGYYTELKAEALSVKTILKNEEESFLKTLARGIEFVNLAVEDLKKEKGKKDILFSGDKAFDLYATYGFPLDLTEDALKRHKIKVDTEAFNKAFLEHKQKAKGTFKQDEAESGVNLIEFQGGKASKFLGYDLFEIEDAKLVKKVASDKKEEFYLVFDKTPFYAESGGQVGDTGVASSSNIKIEILNTQKHPGGAIIHMGKIVSGKAEGIKEGDAFKLIVSKDKRVATMRNHTATHLLHKALRDNLGAHVKQAGSLVEPGRFRFDFSHTGPIPKDVQRKIEDEVNLKILENLPVTKEEMPIDKAKSLGAMALFGEKYGDTARVVKVADFSLELCGGTHVGRTGDIGLFKILSEGSIASGIRRIEAVTGLNAISEFRKTEDELDEAAKILKSQPSEVIMKSQKLVAKVRELEKKIEIGAGEDAKDVLAEIINGAKIANGIKIISREIEVDNPKILRSMADTALDKLSSGIVVLGAKLGGKAYMVVKISKDLSSKHSAKDLIGQISKIIGGGGGGRPEIAEAGGSKPENLKEALDKVYEIIK